MKINFDHIPPDLTARKETRSLRGAVLYLRRYTKTHRPGPAMMRKITRTIRRLMRQLIDTEKFNYAVTTKWEMLTDGAWRQQVMEDLGGETALTHWDTAKVKADVIQYDPPMTDARQTEKDMAARYLNSDAPTTLSTLPSVKTDRDGQFRLAPIKRQYRPLTIQEQWTREEVKAWHAAFKKNKSKRLASNMVSTFTPIPVTPHELRGHATKRTGGPTWEELKRLDAEDTEAERLWFERLVNAPEPESCLERKSLTPKSRSSQRTGPPARAGSCRNTEQEIPDQVWGERCKNIRAGP